MSIVWLARDERLEIDVALKFLPDDVLLRPPALEELKRETRRNLDLTHPHIVRIHSFVQDGRHAAIAMEFVPGASIAHRKVDQPHGVFPVEQVRGWIHQLLPALVYAHETARMIHRDIKPGNLLLDAGGQVKIADFGLALGVLEVAGSQTAGTPAYMSPEQLLGEQPAVTDDIYSLGATLYEMLTGKPPFYSGNIALQVQYKVPPAAKIRRREFEVPEPDGIPVEWETALAACLAKQPDERPRSMRELLVLLEGDETARRLLPSPAAALGVLVPASEAGPARAVSAPATPAPVPPAASGAPASAPPVRTASAATSTPPSLPAPAAAESRKWKLKSAVTPPLEPAAPVIPPPTPKRVEEPATPAPVAVVTPTLALDSPAPPAPPTVSPPAPTSAVQRPEAPPVPVAAPPVAQVAPPVAFTSPLEPAAPVVPPPTPKSVEEPATPAPVEVAVAFAAAAPLGVGASPAPEPKEEIAAPSAPPREAKPAAPAPVPATPAAPAPAPAVIASAPTPPPAEARPSTPAPHRGSDRASFRYSAGGYAGAPVRKTGRATYLLVAALVATFALGAGYYFGLHRPRQDRARVESKAAEQRALQEIAAVRLAAEQAQAALEAKLAEDARRADEDRLAEDARQANLKREQDERDRLAEDVRVAQEIARAAVEQARQLASEVARRDAETARANGRGAALVRSVPAGAEVWLNGQSLGRTPLALRDQSTGPLPLVLRLPGHQDWTGALEIKADEVAELDARLEASPPVTPTGALSSAQADRAPTPAAPPGTSTGIFSLAQVDRAPTPISQPGPVYRGSLRRANIAGEVMVEFTVSPDGSVISAQVLSSDHPELEKPALEAVRKWRYRPALKQGQPVAVSMRVPFVFKIEG
jgi:TonB family protein